MKILGIFVAEPLILAKRQAIFKEMVFLVSVRNSLLLGVGNATIGMVFYSLISYVVVKTRFQGRRVLDIFTWLPYAVPGMVLALALLWTYTGGIPLPFTLFGTLWLMILAIILMEIAMGVRAMNGTWFSSGTSWRMCPSLRRLLAVYIPPKSSASLAKVLRYIPSRYQACQTGDC